MRGPLWTSQEIAEATGGRPTRAFAAMGVSIDSRTLAPGDLFVALRDVRDGHDFVAAALTAGAAGALVDRLPEGVGEDAPLVIVGDTLEGLRGMAAAARARSRAKVVAVTGSVGKTGAKEMLRAIFAGQGAVHAAEKSFNNHWGVPLTLARLPRDADWAVIEIGMNAPGEIAPLSRLARPDVAVITTVEAVHAAAFGSEAGIAREKGAIMEGLGRGGAVVLNRDNRHYDRLRRLARRMGVGRVIRFGTAPRCHARLIRACVSDRSTQVHAQLFGEPAIYKIGAPGRHLAMNSLAAMAAAAEAGADLARAAMTHGRRSPPEGRGSRWRIVIGAGGIDGAVTLIDESYNANPTSMGAALEVLAGARAQDGIGRVARGRRIAFLGDMLELGPDEAALHAGLAGHDAIAKVDRIHTCGPLMRALHEALPPDRRGEHHADSGALAARAGRLLDAGDVAMVKGSFGSRMGRVVEAIKKMGAARPDVADEGA